MIRRDFLKSAVASFFVPALSHIFPAKSLRSPIIAKCIIPFSNGDVQEIYVHKNGTSTNKMDHYDLRMTTSFELENIFELGKIQDYKGFESKPIIEYWGYDKNKNLIYHAEGNQKIWKEC